MMILIRFELEALFKIIILMCNILDMIL